MKRRTSRENKEEEERTRIVGDPNSQTADGQCPEDGAQRLGHAQLDVGGSLAQMKGEHDGNGYDRHVDGKAEVGEEGWERETRRALAVRWRALVTLRRGDVW